LARPLYRTRQVLHALRPRFDGMDLEAALAELSATEAQLFLAMERRDQRHALEVYERLKPRTDDTSVLAAALLHDCGKGSVPVWMRVLNVVAPWSMPALARPGEGWRGAVYRLQHHAELGAALAREAGSSAATVRLIRGHVEPEEAWMHALLRQADDQS
jgi:hypothetical protein